jgi:hypothetical protein
MEMEKASRSKASKATKSSKGSVKHAEPVSQRHKPYEEPEDRKVVAALLTVDPWEPVSYEIDK